MEKEIYLTILFDYYGELLTQKQQEYFSLYYFDNLSLGEISDNLEVSRNAVHKQLKVIEEKLLFFEEKLKLYEKDKKLDTILEKIENKNLKDSIKKIINDKK